MMGIKGIYQRLQAHLKTAHRQNYLNYIAKALKTLPFFDAIDRQ